MNKKQYFIVIEKAENNFSAFSPDIWGCAATGKTVEETVTNMQEALAFHLEDENELPEASNMQQLNEAGAFDELQDFFITRVEISLPNKKGKTVTFKVTAITSKS